MENNETMTGGTERVPPRPMGLRRETKEEETVPLEGLCGWLAGYAAPPMYAIDACGGITEMSDPNKRAEAWKFHFKSCMECGLL